MQQSKINTAPIPHNLILINFVNQFFAFSRK